MTGGLGRRRCLFVTLLAGLAATCHPTDDSSSPPPYYPEMQSVGTMRTWGDEDMKVLMGYWEEGFRKHHPATRFETNLMGTETAMAGLYTGVADMALMGRGISPDERMAFRWMHRDKHEPLAIEVATGSVVVPEKTAAVAVFVHRDNPISRLTLQQVGSIFGGSALSGNEDNVRRWGDYGLSGRWSDEPIHPYGHDIGGEYGVFFRRAVMANSYKWNCDLLEFTDSVNKEGLIRTAGRSILEALADDRYGIAYSAVCYRNPNVKTVALAIHEGAPFVEPTKQHIAARTYPLSRAVSIVIDRPPGHAADPKIKEFLRYVLSRDGQHDVVRTGEYLSLPAGVVIAQLQKLETPGDKHSSVRP